MMKERSQQLFSEVGESIDYIRRDVGNLSHHVAELEELVEAYRAFASKAKLSTADDMVAQVKLLERTQEVIGPPPDKQSESRDSDDSEISAMTKAFRQAAHEQTELE